MLRALLFFLSEAVDSMRRHPAATIASLVSMTAVIFVLGLLLIVTYNVRWLAGTLEQRKGIVVFLETGLSEERCEELAGIFQEFDEVENLRRVSKEEALRELERDLGGVDIPEILGDNPLPDTFVIECREDSRDAETLASLSQEMVAYEGVDDVLYGESWVETLDRGLSTMRRITLLVGTLAAVAVILVLAGTLRLTMIHRRGTLAIMRVIGATYGFIRGPYLVAGVVTVGVAAVTALILLRIAVTLGQNFLPGVRFIPAGWTILLVLGSVGLGLLGSYVALEPMLRKVEGEGKVGPRVGALVLALLLSLGTGFAVARAQETAEYEQELAQLKSEIQSNRARIETLQSQQTNLQEMLERLDRDVRLTRNYISKLDAQEERLEEDLGLRERDLSATRAKLEDLRERLRQRLLDYYKSRRVNLAELLLSSKSFAQLFSRANYMSWSINRDREDLLQVGEEEEALVQKTRELQGSRVDLRRLRDEKSSESKVLESRIRETESEKARIDRELHEHRQRLVELEAREARIKKLMTNLEAGREDRAFEGRALEDQKGRLLWPVEGRIVTGFGSQIHPRFKTRVLSRGIDIAASIGTPIRAVAGAVVAVADWISGYGNCVVLDHGDGFYTLYAHADELLVSKGQQVDRGDVIARVGETDSVKGPGLHFELRKGADALDPMGWLRRR